jgi:hypothetical protein
LLTQRAFDWAIFIILGDTQEIGSDAEEIVLEVQSLLVPLGDDHLIDHSQALEESFLVVVRDGRFPALVVPEHICRRERDNEIISHRTSFLEELKMTGMKDIIATGNEDFFHEVGFFR